MMQLSMKMNGSEHSDAGWVQVSIKDQKKLAERQRKLNEKAVRLKQDALRDDDNVFDVAFENQGETTDTVSATDVKVILLAELLSFEAEALEFETGRPESPSQTINVSAHTSNSPGALMASTQSDSAAEHAIKWQQALQQDLADCGSACIKP